MVRAVNNSLSWSAVLSLIACGGVMTPGMARAQDREDVGRNGDLRREDVPRPDLDPNQEGPGQNQANQNGDAGQDQSANQGVVRLARFASVRGNVTWRADEGLEWSQATTNLPLRQGAQIWVTDGGRAELQFDDGSVLRLGSGALVTLKTLYSDQDGEFTQLTMNEGLATLRARHERSVYRIDTPLVAVSARGPARVRVGVSDGVEVAAREGQVSVEGSLGKATIQKGDYLDLRDANTPYDPRRVPGEDNWDKWNDERDEALDGAAQRPSHQYLPPNISIVATDLDDNGTWRDDPEYGHVWCPRVESADWRPYYQGHWTWVNPFGWTWVSDESWGWAPYHYGTWVSRSYGWAWRPGPVNQYWSPAVVHFTEYGDRVAWCPLAPAEVRYPALLSVGFGRGNWSLFFSIGQAAVYYPSSNRYCEARPFNTGYVNHVTYVNNVTNITNVYNNTTVNRFGSNFTNNGYFAANRNQYVNNNGFVPINARTVAGATYAAKGSFGARAAFGVLPQAGGEVAFRQGRMVGAPPVGARPVMGPAAVQPTRESLTPLHSFASGSRPPAVAMDRAVYRAPLPANIARSARPITPSGVVIPSRTPGGVAGAANGSAPGRSFTPPAGPGRTQVPGASGSQAGNTDRAGGGFSPNSGGAGGRSSAGAGENGVRNGGDARPVNGASASGGYGGRGGRPSGPGSVSGAEAAAQARASLGLPTGHAQASGANQAANGGRAYNGNVPSGGAGAGAAGNSGRATGGSFGRPSGTSQNGGADSRPSYGNRAYGGSSSGGSAAGSNASGSNPASGSGSDGRGGRPGAGASQSGGYDRTQNGSSGAASRNPSGGSRPTYTPGGGSDGSRPSTTPPTRPSGGNPSANGGASSGGGYDRGSRSSEGRTSAPPSSGAGDGGRTYSPPQRQYSPPQPSAPQRQYSPPPTRSAPPAPHDRGGDSAGKDTRSGGDGKTNKDGKDGKGGKG